MQGIQRLLCKWCHLWSSLLEPFRSGVRKNWTHEDWRALPTIDPESCEGLDVLHRMRDMAIDENSVDPDMSKAYGHADDVQCQKRQRVSSPSPGEMQEK